MTTLKDFPVMQGRVEIYRNGELIYQGPNVVVDGGKEWIASRIAESPSPAPAEMNYIAIGTGNTAGAAGDTALDTEIARVNIPASTSSSNQAIFIGTFDAGIGTGAIVEAGIFDAAASGTMLARYVFPVVNKGAPDYITIYWSIQVLYNFF